MFRITIRQLMLFMLFFGVGLAVAGPVERQVLWLRIDAQYAKSVRLANEYFRLTGNNYFFIPANPRDEIPYLNYPPGYWEVRENLERELERQTGYASEAEDVVKMVRQQRIASAIAPGSGASR